MNEQKHNWFLDLILFAGYLIAFFIDLTGIVMHQWIGLIITVLAIVHLALHWNWVKAVFARLFKKTNLRTRLYALIDFLLLAGMMVIFETGLLISTWLNLDFSSFGLMLDIHLWSSIVTLLIVVAKLGLHWRWIVTVAKKIFTPTPRVVQQPAGLSMAAASAVAAASAAAATTVAAKQTQQLNRRQFLVMMGVVTGASAVAISSVLKSPADNSSSNVVSDNTSGTSTTNVQSTATGQATATTSSTQQATASTASSTATATTQATAEPTATTAAGTSNSSTTSCTVRCNRHCAYPGQCHRYTDSNNNGYCDNGECA